MQVTLSSRSPHANERIAVRTGARWDSGRHRKLFTDFLTDCAVTNAVDLNIIQVSEIWHDNFQTVIRGECRLATGDHQTSFHNLCF
jgi:hypothetical protein